MAPGENRRMSGMTIAEAFAEIGRVANACFPQDPNRGYVGARCGWYPEKPKRRRKARAQVHVS